MLPEGGRLANDVKFPDPAPGLLGNQSHRTRRGSTMSFADIKAQDIIERTAAATGPVASVERFLAALADPFLLLTRLYVSWQFLKSGWLKARDWETTVFLFTDEYHVPLLPPTLAAIAGTVGELVFPLLLIVGFYGRLSALGLQAVNVMAVVAYAHVLLTDGFEAALGQHYLWGFMLLTIAIFGPGQWSLDWLKRRRA
jgi:putative oxidoreductase